MLESTVQILCDSERRVTWQKNDKQLSNPGKNKNRLKLKNLSEKESGIYYCEGEINGTKFKVSSVLLVGGMY